MPQELNRAQVIRRLVTIIVFVFVTSSCATVTVTSMPYVSAPQVSPTDAARVEILQSMPARPHERLGEISVTATTAPAPAISDLQKTLQRKAGALGADAVVVVYDSLQPIAASAYGGWSDRTVYAITGRRLVAVAIKYR